MNRTPQRQGFTVVELLVAMAVFSIVVSIATGAFIRALRTQRQLVSFAAANSNVSLVLEQMAREIRVGNDFNQNRQPTSLTLTNGRGEEVTYAFDEEEQAITRTVSGGVQQQMTSENVAVKQLQFIVQHEGDDGYPARITIIAAVSPEERGVDTSVVRIQTTVSARNLGS